MHVSRTETSFSPGRRASIDSLGSIPRAVATKDRTERTAQNQITSSPQRWISTRRRRPNETARARIQEHLGFGPDSYRGRDGGGWSTTKDVYRRAVRSNSLNIARRQREKARPAQIGRRHWVGELACTFPVEMRSECISGGARTMPLTHVNAALQQQWMIEPAASVDSLSDLWSQWL